MDVETIANYAEIIGACTILTAVIFGLSQNRLQRALQENRMATQLTQTFMEESLAMAVAKLRSLPDGISAAELRALGPEYEQAAIRVTMSFETMGLLVYRGFAERDLVLDLAGGIMGVMWRKLYAWQMALRDEQQQPSWAEWFEWLATQSYAVKHAERTQVSSGTGRATEPRSAGGPTGMVDQTQSAAVGTLQSI